MANDNSEEKIKNFDYCFILGAGASCDFGYPTGIGLIKRIADKLKAPANDFISQIIKLPSLSQVQQGLWVDNGEKFEKYCEELGNRIFFSGVTSIDRFLSNYKENEKYQEICKYLIIEEILASEGLSRNPTIIKEKDLSWDCYRWEQNWLRTLFGYFFVKDNLGELTSSLEEKPICFISFNYDRLLEYFLTQSIVHLYGLAPSQKPNDLISLKRILKAITIKHVYGRFDGNSGELDEIWNKYGRSSEEKKFEFIKNIRTIRPGNELTDDYSQFIQNSKQVFFLGFGFDEMNVNILFRNIDGNLRNQIFATKYGLSERVIGDMNRKFYKFFPQGFIAPGDQGIFWARDTESKIYDYVSNRFGK